ncbi:hypothetical protein CCACVL1_05410 [Corchorus capsularis]|uniref:Uncharacterized protein n=1 Tax=Corchorus capsularis TaxID=210143 RepID=A0A1R3JKP7_COCAP|nr:hypothetical protein CCACVL1_05410 [Corchorus capsularis]
MEDFKLNHVVGSYLKLDSPFQVPNGESQIKN